MRTLRSWGVRFLGLGAETLATASAEPVSGNLFSVLGSARRRGGPSPPPTTTCWRSFLPFTTSAGCAGVSAWPRRWRPGSPGTLGRH